jgi:hypothetical protein
MKTEMRRAVGPTPGTGVSVQRRTVHLEGAAPERRRRPPQRTADVSARGYDLYHEDHAHHRRGATSPLFYDFVSMSRQTVVETADRVPPPVLVGDAMQEVNRWNGSDARFMTMAPELNGRGVDGWRRLELTITSPRPWSSRTTDDGP